MGSARPQRRLWLLAERAQLEAPVIQWEGAFWLRSQGGAGGRRSASTYRGLEKEGVKMLQVIGHGRLESPLAEGHQQKHRVWGKMELRVRSTEVEKFTGHLAFGQGFLWDDVPAETCCESQALMWGLEPEVSGRGKGGGEEARGSPGQGPREEEAPLGRQRGTARLGTWEDRDPKASSHLGREQQKHILP